MLVSFTRTIILYILVIIAMRIMDKKQVGDLDPIEFVIILLFSELASIPMQDIDLPLVHSLVPIATLISLELIISALTLKSRRLRLLLDGKPVIIVRHGKMDISIMKSLRYSIDELLELLRQEGYADIRDVEFAILENSGKISIIPSVSGKVPTAKDLNLKLGPGAMPFPVILDGKIVPENLTAAGINKSKLDKLLHQKGISSVKEVFYAVYDSCGEFYLQKKEMKK
ncbi:MAG: DUF421 domain-containing protein [Clostridia bacterium]|nr:DUF421 domain-containing protein [Clostridia bacterium]MBR2973308.1 DUF421 domain-containing protein [Clostridia bacterium]